MLPLDCAIRARRARRDLAFAAAPSGHNGSVLAVACAILLVATLVGFPLHQFWPHTLDDAFISFTYARNLADGNGVVFNPGERVEGFSNPMWVFLLATSSWVGLPILGMAKALGAASAGLSVLLAATTVFTVVSLADARQRKLSSNARKRRTKRDSAKTRTANEARVPRGFMGVPMLAALACAAGMVAHPGFAYYGVAGLETSLFGVLVLSGVLLHLKPLIGLGSGGTRWCYLPLGVAAITRPEGVMFLLITSLHRAWLSTHSTDPHSGGAEPPARRTLRREVAPAMIGWSFPIGYLAYRLIYFAEFLPNTFYAKPSTILENPLGGLSYVWDFVTRFGWGIAVISACCVVVASFRSPIRRAIHFLILLIIVYAGFVVYVGGDWMAQDRFFQHILPLISLTVAVSLATAPIRFRRPVFMLLLGLCVWQTKDVMAFCRDLDANSAYDHAHSSKHNIEMAQWMSEHLPAGATIVADEIGAIGYYSGLQVIDQWGLIDKRVARIISENEFNPYGSAIDSPVRHGTQAQIAQEMLGRNPDFVLIDYVGTWQIDRGYDPDYVNPITMQELHNRLVGRYELVRGFSLMRSPPKTFLLFHRLVSRLASERSISKRLGDRLSSPGREDQ